MSTIQPSEVQWFLSNPTASTGFSGVGTPGNSRGRYMSTTLINTAVPLDDLFLDLNALGNAAGEVDYQCLFLANNTATGFYMKNPVVWLPTMFYVDYTTTTQIGMDPTGVVPQTGVTPQAALINAQTQSPGVTTWVFPTATLVGGVAVPDIPPGYCVAIWFKRTATNMGPTPIGTPDGAAITVSFQSNA